MNANYPMRMFLRYLLIFVLAFFPLSGEVKASSELDAPQIDYINKIKERGFLKVGLPPYVTPTFYYPDEKTGEMAGYDIDLVNGFANKLGVDVEFDRDSKNFNDTVFRAGKGDFDLAIGKLSTTYKRMSDTHPHEYMNFRQALLVNRRFVASIDRGLSEDILGQDLLNSKMKVGIIGGSSWESYANQFMPSAQKIGYKDWPAVKKALFETNEIDAIYRDATEIKKIIYQEPNLSIKYVPILFNDVKDVISIFLPTDANIAMSDVLDFYLRDYGIKGDAEIMEELSDFYNPIS